MNDRLKAWLENMKDFLAAMTLKKKILLGSVGVVLALAATAAMMMTGNDPYDQLYSDLTPEDMSAITRKLSELNIEHQVSQDKKTVSVLKSKVDAARMELAKEGLPGEDVVGFETFDSFSFGTSSYVQRIQYVRAVQGELTRSIQRLAAVKRARVHISVPPKKTFLEDQDPPKASVVLEMRAGKRLAKSEIKGIAHIVSSAVEGLTSEQVTVVDTKGRFLHRPQEEGSEVSHTLLELQRSIESEYEKHIEDLLTPIVGMGKVIARVTAELDHSQIHVTEETYDPERSVPKNVVKNDKVNNGSRPNPIGIPGSRSNLPGAEVEETPVPVATTNSEHNISTTDYSVPKKVETKNKPSGNIKRLTVAVVVDGTYQKDPANPEAADTFVPRAEEELQRFQDIIANSVGFDTQRRDSITVSSLPFTPEEIEELDTPKPINWQEFLDEALKNGLIGLVLVLFFMLVLRPFLKWATLRDMEDEIAVLPKTVAEIEAAQEDEGVRSLSKAVSLLESSETLQKKEEAELTKRILEEVDKAPTKGFQIVREWLGEGTIVPTEASEAA